MDTNLSRCLAFTEKFEGRYQASRHDNGNWTGGNIGSGLLVGTMRGISAPIMQRWMDETGDDRQLTSAIMRTMPESIFSDIAKRFFWNPFGCAEMASGIDLMVFDFGFNTGENGLRCCYLGQQPSGMLDAHLSSLTIAQIAPYLTGDQAVEFQDLLNVKTDGIIGPETQAAASAAGMRDGMLIFALASRQRHYYRQLSSFRRFGRGWLARTEARMNAALDFAYPGLRTAV